MELAVRAALVIAVAMVLAYPAPAQQPVPGPDARSPDTLVTLRVRVTGDSVTGAPIEGVLIRAAGMSARTDAAGRASVRLPAGPRFIIATRIGFRPDSVFIFLRTRADTEISIALVAQTTEIEGVVVSATRGERRVQDTPLRVEIVDEEEVAEKSSMRPGSVAMLLAETGGLRVQTTSPSLGGAAVRVQGLRGRYSLLLADGLPLYGGQAGGLGLLQIPPVDLGRVEIIKGTASALYGSSALGGVVNLVSRRPGPEREREMLVNQTSRDGTDVVMFAAAPISARWGYTVLGGAHRQRRQDLDGDAWTDMPGYRRVVVRPRLFFADEAGRSAFLTAGVTGEEREGGTMNGVAPDGAPYDERLQTRRADIGGLGRVLITSGPLAGGLLTIRGSAMEQRHAHTFGVVREDDRHRTWFAEAAVAIPRGRVTPVVGVALEQDAYRAFSVPDFDYTYTIPSLFAQADVDVASRLTLSLNARLDAHSAYGTFVNPRLSVLVRAPAEGALVGWTVRLSGGTGAFAPTPFTEETEVTGLAPLAPLDGLRAERARSASLDIGGPVDTPVGRVELAGTLFGSAIEHAVQVRDLPGTTPAGASRLTLFNAPQSTRTWGGELLARLSRDPFRVTATYTQLRATEWDPGNSPGESSRRVVPLNPRHALGLVASVEREGESRLGLELYYTGRQSLEYDPGRRTSAPYLLVGVLGERRFGRARLFVNAENLTDVRQTRDGPLVLPARGPGGRWTTDVWAPLEGFVVNAGARVGL
ncbi:MAG TPA: TonB-dependent receptor [Gemmatimonadaceae bacterium]|nr:TonB-dependent receptor [Gemmatimonadaceae bacterium]